MAAAATASPKAPEYHMEGRNKAIRRGSRRAQQRACPRDMHHASVERFRKLYALTPNKGTFLATVDTSELRSAASFRAGSYHNTAGMGGSDTFQTPAKVRCVITNWQITPTLTHPLYGELEYSRFICDGHCAQVIQGIIHGTCFEFRVCITRQDVVLTKWEQLHKARGGCLVDLMSVLHPNAVHERGLILVIEKYLY